MLALITGASSGIGKSISLYLSNLGYDLIIVGRNKDKLNSVKNKCKTNVEIINLDLFIIDNVYKLYDIAKDKNIDILVNNAGFGILGEFKDINLDKELDMINLNIITPHILTKLFIRDFIKKDRGYILNVASSAGFMSGPLFSTYYSTKNYILKQSLAIYEELRRNKSNVKISILCPGPVDTNFNNIAGVTNEVKYVSSDYIAKYAIDKMFKNKLIIIPALRIKLAILFSRFIPTKLLLKITYNIQKNKLK